MSCCTQYRAHADVGRGALDVEVMGTWDFKWPAGRKIRVAFQRPRAPYVSGTEFDRVRATIAELAETWTKGGANLAFDWVDYVFSPPADGHRQNRSGFGAVNAKDAEYRDYDVLVSIEDLPLVHNDPIVADRVLDRIFLPKSELGSYARRADYGVATLFIGRLPALSQRSLREYYEHDRLARFYVVHEFGHVLGLAHEHQNPRRRAKNDALAQLPRQTADVTQRVSRWLGTVTNGFEPSVLGDFVRRNITEPWPGNPEFSDWREDDEDSVLFVPYQHCLIADTGMPDPRECEHCHAKLFDHPSPKDLEHLRAMYPPA